MRNIKIDDLPVPLRYVVAILKEKSLFYPADFHSWLRLLDDKYPDKVIIFAFEKAAPLTESLEDCHHLFVSYTHLKSKSKSFSDAHSTRLALNSVKQFIAAHLEDHEFSFFSQIIKKQKSHFLGNIDHDFLKVLTILFDYKANSFEDYLFLQEIYLELKEMERVSRVRDILFEIALKETDSFVKYCSLYPKEDNLNKLLEIIR